MLGSVRTCPQRGRLPSTDAEEILGDVIYQCQADRLHVKTTAICRPRTRPPREDTHDYQCNRSYRVVVTQLLRIGQNEKKGTRACRRVRMQENLELARTVCMHGPRHAEKKKCSKLKHARGPEGPLLAGRQSAETRYSRRERTAVSISSPPPHISSGVSAASLPAQPHVRTGDAFSSILIRVPDDQHGDKRSGSLERPVFQRPHHLQPLTTGAHSFTHGQPI